MRFPACFRRMVSLAPSQRAISRYAASSMSIWCCGVVARAQGDRTLCASGEPLLGGAVAIEPAPERCRAFFVGSNVGSERTFSREDDDRAVDRVGDVADSGLDCSRSQRVEGTPADLVRVCESFLEQSFGLLSRVYAPAGVDDGFGCRCRELADRFDQR